MKTVPSWVAKRERIQTPAITKSLGKMNGPLHLLLGQPAYLPGPAAFLSPQHFLFKSPMAMALVQQDQGWSIACFPRARIGGKLVIFI